MKPVNASEQIREIDYTYTAAQTAQAVGGQVVRGRAGEVLRGFSTNSQQIRAGEAFFALVGTRFNAHDFVPEALIRGAAGIIVDHVDPTWTIPEHCAVVVVPDTTLALRDTAAFHRGNLKARTIAVTGSCGKSTTKSYLTALLSALGPTSSPPESFNNRVGVSLTVLSARQSDEFLVMELGANHAGEIDELAGVARPHVGVITVVGEAHLEGFGSLEGVREAKGELLRHILPGGAFITNGENEHCRILARRFRRRARTFGFGRDMDYHPDRIAPFGDGVKFCFRGKETLLRIPGRFNVLNALAAIGGCEALEQDVMGALDALADVTPPPLRSQVTRLDDFTFVEDCYNNNATAILAAVDFFDSLRIRGRRIAVFGDMKELGPDSGRIHRRIGGQLAARGVDCLLGFGEFARDLTEGFLFRSGPGRPCYAFDENELKPLCDQLLAVLEPGCCAVIKGSRSMKMERVLETVRRTLDQSAARTRNAA